MLDDVYRIENKEVPKNTLCFQRTYILYIFIIVILNVVYFLNYFLNNLK